MKPHITHWMTNDGFFQNPKGFFKTTKAGLIKVFKRMPRKKKKNFKKSLVELREKRVLFIGKKPYKKISNWDGSMTHNKAVEASLGIDKITYGDVGKMAEKMKTAMAKASGVPKRYFNK